MGKCRYCGREVGGYRDFSLSPICPECELVKLEKERQVEEQRQQAENEWRQREQEFAAQKRHEEEEEEKQRRHEEQLSAIRYAEEERQRRHEEELYAIAAAEEANQRRFEESQTLQQQDNDFENSKMRCLWCGDSYTFRNDEGHGVYCSKKCAIDDLGKHKYHEYLKQIDILLQEKVIQDIEAKQYLSAIICAEGCKNLPVDLKGKIGHYCLKIPNRNIDQSWGKMILKEAVLAGSFASAKLFLLHNPFTNLSCSAYSKMAKLLLPYFESMEKDFYSASDSIEKLDALEQISLKWKGSSIVRGKIFEFIQKRKNDFFQAEYDTALKCKNGAKTADKYFKAAKLFNILANKDFKDARLQVEICRNIAYQIEYDNALRQKTNAKTAKAYFKAAELFDALTNKDFKDTRQQVEICRNMGIQKKIDFATKMEKKAYKFEDYLSLLILYLELTELKVENANLWLEVFYQKAVDKLDASCSPKSYEQCMRLLDMIAEKGFRKASTLRRRYIEKIEKQWKQVSSYAISAKCEAEFYTAIRHLIKFKSLKTEKEIDNVFQDAIEKYGTKRLYINALWFSVILGVLFVFVSLYIRNNAIDMLVWSIFFIILICGYGVIAERKYSWYDGTICKYCYNGVSWKIVEANNVLIIELGTKYVTKEFPCAVKCIKDCNQSLAESVNKVAISEFIDAIGESAFYGCKNLTSVVIPNSVTEIGRDAFENCENLTRVVIPDGITKIEKNTFCGCKNLTSVVIPDDVTEIGEFAFYGCENLTSVVIPDGVTEIGRGAFAYCKNLTRVVIPEGVTKIEKNTFYSCENLTSVVIPNNVTEIENGAFYCTKLTNVEISQKTKINIQSFRHNDDFDDFDFDSFPLGCEIKYRD